MKRNGGKVGEAPARHRERRLDGRFQAVGIEREPGRSAVFDIAEHLLRPLANGRRRAQVGGGLAHRRGRATPVARLRLIQTLSRHSWRSLLRLGGARPAAFTRRGSAPWAWRAQWWRACWS